MANLLGTIINGNLVTTGGVTTSNYTRILYPSGGSYVTQTSVVNGAIRIKLPTQGSAMMMSCTVKVYEYSTGKSFTITFGGHRDGANWYNEFCYIDGDQNRGNLTVRFGVSGGKDCVWIGETSSSWSYPQVFVTDVQLGYAGYSAAWASGWEVAFVTSFDTINRTQTAYAKITSGNIASQSVSYASYAGRAYPQRSDGQSINFYWDGQGGQPTWLWGSNNGTDFYVWNPSNFSVNYASSSGSSGVATYARRIDGPDRIGFNVGGDASTFYPIAIYTGAASTSQQYSEFVIERGGYEDPGYTGIGFSTFNARFTYKPNGWGYQAAYFNLEQLSQTTTMLGDYVDQYQSSQAIIWLRGGTRYNIYSVYGSITLLFANESGTSYSMTYGTYDPITSARTKATTTKYYEGSVRHTGVIYSSDSIQAPIFYDSDNTGYYVNPANTSNVNRIDVLNTYVGNAIYFGGGNNYFNWDGARINSNVGIQSGSDMRAPIFYDSADTTYYLDPNAGTSLKIAGGIVSTAANGAVLLKHENSEANAWIFQENAANWGLFWFNAGGQSGQTIGSYTTVGAELFGMNNAVTGYNPNSAWSGTDANTRAAWMLSNYGGYLWTQGTQYSETDMRAPIFYDSQDTTYYVDPNSTSKLVQVNLGTSNTRLIADSATGYLKVYGSASNYLVVGPYNNNGWAYLESIGNSSGLYLYTESSGRFAFDNGAVTPYTDGENSLGTPSYRWSNVYTAGWLRQYGNQGMYNESYGTHFYSNGSDGFVVTGSGGVVELQFRSNHQSTLRGYVYADTSNNIGFLNNGGGWNFRTASDKNAFVHGQTLTINADNAGWSSIYMNDGDEGNREIHCNSNRIGFLTQAGSWGAYLDDSTNWYAAGSMQAPIFYDSQDTGYYVDPNGTSELNQISAATSARWGRSGNYWTVRPSLHSGVGYWTGTNGWGTGEGTWANAWKGGFSGWDIWGTGTDHPQGSGYIHAQGIVSGIHYTTTNGGEAYGWMMVGANQSVSNRYWLRGKWGTTTSEWVEMITTGNISSQSVSYASSAGNADTVDNYHASSLWRSDGGNWNPGANITLYQTGNSQEWSFDIYRQGYTGGYWHVWDSSHGTMLGVDATNNYVWASGSMRAPIFYDLNDTNYYVNPSDYSYLWRTSTHIAPSPGVGSSNWVNDFNNTPVSSMSFGGDLSSNGPESGWWFQQNMRHGNSSSSWGTQIAWGWESNANELRQRNVSAGTWSNWTRYINTNNFQTILNPYYFSVPAWTTGTQTNVRSNYVTGGRWYRIANLGTERFFARVRIYDDSSGGPHSSVEFQVAGAFNNPSGYSFTMTSNGYYSAPSVTEVRILSAGTYDPQYLEVYINYVGYQYSSFAITLLEARNATLVNFDEGGVPSGYSRTSWLCNAPLATGGRRAIFNDGFVAYNDVEIPTIINTNRFDLESSRAVSLFGHVGRYVSTQSAQSNYIPFSFESTYGNHSWGQITRFHIQQSGADRPSIQFSSGSGNTRWNVGYCYPDDNFRITQNMGMRPDNSGTNDGWGTERFKIDTNGWVYTGAVVSDNWFRPSGATGLYFGSYGYGIYAAEAGGSSYGNVATYASGANSWPGYAISNFACLMAREVRRGIFLQDKDSWLIRYENSINQAVVDFELSWGSDIRYKSNVNTISSALDKVTALRGVTYNYKGAEKTSIGFIAQEVEQVVPEVVSTDLEGYKSVAYANMVALLTEAIKEQQTIINDLKARIELLESK